MSISFTRQLNTDHVAVPIRYYSKNSVCPRGKVQEAFSSKEETGTFVDMWLVDVDF